MGLEPNLFRFPFMKEILKHMYMGFLIYQLAIFPPINFHKTCMSVFTKFNSPPSQDDFQKLNCLPSVLPITYLGVPIVGRRPRKQDWKKLIALARAKLRSWKTKFLSLGGRLNLINLVFSTIPTY